MFLILPWVSKGANLTCTLICLMLLARQELARQKLGEPLPPIWYIQTDMGSENWNATVFALLGLLVHYGVFETIHFNRLPVGHTHEDIDSIFGILSVVLKICLPTTISAFILAIYTGLAKKRSKARHSGCVSVRIISAVFNFTGFFKINTDVGGYGADRYKHTSTGDAGKDDFNRDKRMIRTAEFHSIVVAKNNSGEVVLTFQENSTSREKEEMKLSDMLDTIPEREETPDLLVSVIEKSEREKIEGDVKKIMLHVGDNKGNRDKGKRDASEWASLGKNIPSDTSVPESNSVLGAIREGGHWTEGGDGGDQAATRLVVGETQLTWPLAAVLTGPFDHAGREDEEKEMEQMQVGRTVPRLTHRNHPKKQRALEDRAAQQKLFRVRRRNAVVRQRLLTGHNGGGGGGGEGGGRDGGGEGGEGGGRGGGENDEENGDEGGNEGGEGGEHGRGNEHDVDNDPVQAGEFVLCDLVKTWPDSEYKLRYLLGYVNEVLEGDGLAGNSLLRVSWWHTRGKDYKGTWRQWKLENNSVSTQDLRRAAVVCAGGIEFTRGSQDKSSRKLTANSWRAAASLSQEWPQAE